MTKVGSEWPKWGRNGPSVLDTYFMYLFEARAVRNGYCICDNRAVYKNTSMHKSQLRKKHHIISYHMSREAVASGACRMEKKDTDTNLSDLFTKLLLRPRRELLLESFTY